MHLYFCGNAKAPCIPTQEPSGGRFSLKCKNQRNICRALLQMYRSLLRIYVTYLWVKRTLSCLFLVCRMMAACMCVYVWLFGGYTRLIRGYDLRIHRALVQIRRAILRICRALSRIYRTFWCRIRGPNKCEYHFALVCVVLCVFVCVCVCACACAYLVACRNASAQELLSRDVFISLFLYLPLALSLSLHVLFCCKYTHALAQYHRVSLNSTLKFVAHICMQFVTRT